MLKKILLTIGIVFALFAVFNYLVMPMYVNHYETVKVPKVTGMNILDATKIVEENGLDIKQADIKYDEKIPIGQILDQNPPPDVMVKAGRRVYVTICGGEQLAEVPNLRGRSLRDAKFALEQRGLHVGEAVRKNTNEFPADVVITQVIQPGSKVKRNTKIELIVSDGPVMGDLKVPMIVGKKLEEAKKIITDAKLRVGKITYQTNNEVPPGQIVDQYPKADKSANENTTVEVFVARKKVDVKSFEEDSEMSVEGNADVNGGDDKQPKQTESTNAEKPQTNEKAPDKTTPNAGTDKQKEKSPTGDKPDKKESEGSKEN